MATTFNDATTIRDALEILDDGVKRGALIFYNGDPNGVVTGSVGALCLDHSGTAKIWQNSTGGTVWVDKGTPASPIWNIINYISNYGAESDIAGYVAYADAAGTSPVDGTGGSPALTVTRTTSGTLRGVGSILVTKDAVNRQGEGVGYNFTIDEADKGKVLSASFDYIVGSGAFTAGSPTTDSDITVWIYDTTNSRLIQPSEYKLYSNSSTGAFSFVGTFQSSPDSTNYRLIFHVGTTNASAWTLKVDNVVVGPMLKTVTSAISDWQAFPSVSADTLITATNTSPTYGTVAQNVAYWRRVGDSMEILWDYRQTTAGGAGIGTYLFNLPSGYQIDTTRLPANTSQFDSVVGDFKLFSANAGTDGIGKVAVYSSTQLWVQLFRVTLTPGVAIDVTWAASSSAINFSSGTDMAYCLRATVPIAGWGSNVELNSMDSNRPVSLSVRSLTGASYSPSSPVVWATVNKDTHAAYSSGSYTIPSSGDYFVAVSNAEITNTNDDLKVFINGSASDFHLLRMVSNQSTGTGGSVLVTGLRGGDVLSIRPAANTCTFTAIANSTLSIYKIATATQIGANETVAASYYCSANQSASSSTPVNFDTKIKDTHNAVTTGSGWRFTAPYPGEYSILGFCGSGTAGVWMKLYKNGSLFNGSLFYLQSTSGVSPVASSIQLLAGDYIEMRPDSSITLNGGALTSVNISQISIYRI